MEDEEQLDMRWQFDSTLPWIVWSRCVFWGNVCRSLSVCPSYLVYIREVCLIIAITWNIFQVIYSQNGQPLSLTATLASPNRTVCVSKKKAVICIELHVLIYMYITGLERTYRQICIVYEYSYTCKQQTIAGLIVQCFLIFLFVIVIVFFKGRQWLHDLCTY